MGLNIARMRRRAQLVQDAETERAAATAAVTAAVVLVSHISRFLADLAGAFGLVQRPAAPKYTMPTSIVPPLSIGPIRGVQLRPPAGDDAAD